MLQFIEIKIPKEVTKLYLEKKFKKPVKIIEYKRLGTGWHGTGYKVVFSVNKKKQTVILRTLRPEGFSHDYSADRAKVFILQHKLSNKIPKHIASIDVIGYKKGELVSLGNCEEFFQIVELAKGNEYVRDLEEIKKRGKLTEKDKKRALMLSDYLVKLHKNKFNVKTKEEKAIANSIYRRHTRDCIGDGEMLMGVLDTYPKVNWTNSGEFAEIIYKAAKFREKIKNLSHRLCTIHGDFHPGNILFDNSDFKVLDASREEFGEPADDVSAFLINYIMFGLNEKFEGPFKELFDLFWQNYLKKTKDNEMKKTIPLFFAFRAVVVAHPIFYSEHSTEFRKKIFRFIKNILDENEFNFEKVQLYLD